MKKFVVLISFLGFCLCIFAQDNNKFNLTGDLRTGTGFAPLFGLKTSNDLSIYYMVDIQHKETGLGVGAYRFDDFQKTGNGRIGFLDCYWSGNLSKNVSLYSAIEYGFFDNDKSSSYWCPYVILNFNSSIINVDIAPMYCYYDQLKSSQFVFRLRTVKEIYKGGTLRLSGWYNNLLIHKFYSAVGFTQQLPKNFYLQGDILFREEKVQPLLCLGYKF